MQWTNEARGGFSRAERPVRPVINDEIFGYEKVNVAQQRRDPESILNWAERRIRMRKECPELGWGDFTVLSQCPRGVSDSVRLPWRVYADPAQFFKPTAILGGRS